MNTDKIYAEKIASEYAPKTTRKIKALIRLDKWIKKPVVITAYIIGTFSAVSFLVGFSLIVYNQLLIGTTMKILGLVGMSISPIVYKTIFNKRKNKNANDILLLIEEIIIEDTFEQ